MFELITAFSVRIMLNCIIDYNDHGKGIFSIITEPSVYVLLFVYKMYKEFMLINFYHYNTASHTMVLNEILNIK